MPTHNSDKVRLFSIQFFLGLKIRTNKQGYNSASDADYSVTDMLHTHVGQDKNVFVYRTKKGFFLRRRLSIEIRLVGLLISKEGGGKRENIRIPFHRWIRASLGSHTDR